VLGGITGVMLASPAFDAQAHDSYFAVGHFHYALVGGVIFPLFAGLHYWLPKFTGRLLSERLGRWTFGTMFVGFNVAFLPMHLTGLLGMPRRVYTYQAGLGWELPNLISTMGALVLALGILLFVVNVLWSLRSGDTAVENPWGGDTLEWAVTSPPPTYQFWSLPVVRSRHPLWDQRDLAADDATLEAELAAVRGRPIGWRSALTVSTVHGRPEGIAWIPGPTLWPLLLSLGFTALFTGALLNDTSITGLGVLATAVATAGWFWPTRSQQVAIDEMRVNGYRVIPDRPTGAPLPLVLIGRGSPGWWGMMVLIAVLAVALASLVTSYFYLAARWPARPIIDAMERVLWGGTGLFLVLGAVLLRLTTRGEARSRGRRRIGLAMATVMGLAASGLVAGTYFYREASSTRTVDAHGSLMFALVSFQGLATLAGVVLMLVAQLWLWRRPNDPRGDAVTELVVPYWFFVVASWAVVLATAYL
jgi:cytochrome c oxidase subunit I+III